MTSTAVLHVETREVEVGGTPRRLLVARPNGQIRLGGERLETMRSGNFVSGIDMEILQAVAAQRPGLALVIFDANGADPEHSWAFDPDLGDEERMELGAQLLRSQITLYRHLVKSGVTGLVGVGFGSFALAAFQRGTVRVLSELAAEMEDADEERAAVLELDAWLLEHAATWTGLPLAEFLDTRVAEEITAREAKRAEVDGLLARVQG